MPSWLPRHVCSRSVSDVVHTTLNLVSLYHDSLLAKAVANLPPSVRKPEPSPHNRYTQFWAKASQSYKNLALVIVVIQYGEVLLEMGAKKKWGEKGRWRTIVAIEALKFSPSNISNSRVICRFGLLSLTKARPLVSPPLPGREIDPQALEELANTPHTFQADMPSPSLSSQSSISEDDPNHPYTLPRTGLTLPSLSSTASPSPFAGGDGITSYLVSRVLTVEDIKPAAQLLPRLNGLSWYAEVLYILRPLLYALIMQRWVRTRGEKNAKRSWWPWLLGLSIEYAAMELRKREEEKSFRNSLGKLEKEEVRRRGKAMWWWILRGAMYENVSKYPPLLKR
jgi:peroxin-16